MRGESTSRRRSFAKQVVGLNRLKLLKVPSKSLNFLFLLGFDTLSRSSCGGSSHHNWIRNYAPVHFCTYYLVWEKTQWGQRAWRRQQRHSGRRDVTAHVTAHSGLGRLENLFLIDAVSIIDDFDGIGVCWSPEFKIDVAVALGQSSQPGSVT